MLRNCDEGQLAWVNGRAEICSYMGVFGWVVFIRESCLKTHDWSSACEIFLERNTVGKILWKISEIKCLGCKIAKKPGFNSYICQKPSAKTLHSFRKQENRKLLPSEICNCNKVIVYSFLFKSLWIISNWVRRSRKAEKVNDAFCLHLRRPVLAIPDHCCDFFHLSKTKHKSQRF